MTTAPNLCRPGGHITSYRPDIDGLRAFAVLAVVFFHAFPDAWKGGFIGVDVFFVISGYLIGGVILDDIDKDRFTFRNFYFRRIRRIFPALVTVLAATLIAGWLLFLPDEYAALGKHTFGGASFLSNFFFWQESGYFDTEAKTKPLLHLWSLGIEEQFYIVFPFVLWLCAKNRRLAILTILLLCGGSFAVNIGLSHSRPVAEFYSPLSRVWELLIGSALSAFMRQPELIPPDWRRAARRLIPAEGRTIRLILAVAGLSFLLLSLLAAKRPAHWPGWTALLPTAGTAMLIAAGPETWINRKIFSHRFAVGIGLVSYPFYLWHWPLLSCAFIFNGWMAVPPRSTRAVLVVIAFLLAVATYRMIEKPVRFGQRAQAFKFACLVLGMLLVGGAGGALWLQDGLPSRIPDIARIDKALEAMADRPFWGEGERKTYQGAEYWEQASRAKRTTLFIGDSFAQHYWPRVDDLIASEPDETNSAIFMICQGNMPIRGNGACNGYAEKALEMAKNSPDIANIVISASWKNYLSRSEKEKGVLNILSNYMKDFIAAGKKVFLVSYAPRHRALHPRYTIKRDITAFPHTFSMQANGVDRSILEKQYGTTPDALEKAGREAGAEIIRPMDFLCGERCEALDGRGNPIYFDDGHLRGSFARSQARFIDRVMR